MISKKIIFFILTILSLFSTESFADEAKTLCIFVSFSMPMKSIQNLLHDANKIKVPLVIRGLYQNSFRETTKKVLNFLPNQKGGVLLDPTLFKRFRVYKVPAFLITTQSCIADRACDAYDIIYGDVTLSYALDEFKSRNSKDAAYIEALLYQLEEDS